MKKNKFFCGPGEQAFCCGVDADGPSNEKNGAPRTYGDIGNNKRF